MIFLIKMLVLEKTILLTDQYDVCMDFFYLNPHFIMNFGAYHFENSIFIIAW